MAKGGMIDTLVMLLVGVIIIYVGFTVLYTVNPVLAFLFAVLGVYVIFRGVTKG